MQESTTPRASKKSVLLFQESTTPQASKKSVLLLLDSTTPGARINKTSSK
ncbi:hypothetical protein CY35_16G100800 [Sphagnum magellanicum]|nr:hypothetical protein CY35_16G100800 [Sphagnum magellanicum]